MALRTSTSSWSDRTSRRTNASADDRHGQLYRRLLSPRPRVTSPRSLGLNRSLRRLGVPRPTPSPPQSRRLQRVFGSLRARHASLSASRCRGDQQQVLVHRQPAGNDPVVTDPEFGEQPGRPTQGRTRRRRSMAPNRASTGPGQRRHARGGRPPQRRANRTGTRCSLPRSHLCIQRSRRSDRATRGVIASARSLCPFAHAPVIVNTGFGGQRTAPPTRKIAAVPAPSR